MKERVPDVLDVLAAVAIPNVQLMKTVQSRLPHSVLHMAY